MTTALDRDPPPGRDLLPLARGTVWLDCAVLTAVAMVLRFYHLSGQLWTDEVFGLVSSFRKSAPHIVTHPVTHPLYELMAHSSIRLFGDSAWAARLPAALFGTATVPVFYLVIRRAVGRPDALLAGGLLAVSLHHITFSQDARGYTAMLFFAMVATLFLLPLPRPVAPRVRWAYVAVASLAAYCVPFGAAVVAGHFAATVPMVWWRSHRGDREPTQPIRSLVTMFALTGAAIVVLYLPIFLDPAGFQTAAHGSTAASMNELLTGLRTALGGNAGVIAALAVAAIGAVDYVRRAPAALALLGTPVAGSVAVLVGLGIAIHPRFLTIALPLGFAVSTRGLLVIAGAGAATLARAGRRPSAAVGVSAALLVVAVSTKPLPYYYRVPKQDFVGALRFVDRARGPGDNVVAAAIAGDIIKVYYRPAMPSVQSVSALNQAETKADRLYVLTTLEGQLRPGDRAIFERLHRRYRVVRIFGGTIQDGSLRVYRSETANP